MGQFSLQALLAFVGRIGGARGRQPTIEFLIDQDRIFQQSDHFAPDNLIKEASSDHAAVIAQERGIEIALGVAGVEVDLQGSEQGGKGVEDKMDDGGFKRGVDGPWASMRITEMRLIQAG